MLLRKSITAFMGVPCPQWKPESSRCDGNCHPEPRVLSLSALPEPGFRAVWEILMVVLNALIPVFGLILLGWLFGARGVIPADGGRTLGVITVKLFMPVLLFSGIARADLAEAMSPQLVLIYYLTAISYLVGVYLLIHLRLERTSAK